eukprot:1185476-Prorocentrum_minimum.AAC.1
MMNFARGTGGADVGFVIRRVDVICVQGPRGMDKMVFYILRSCLRLRLKPEKGLCRKAKGIVRRGTSAHSTLYISLRLTRIFAVRTAPGHRPPGGEDPCGHCEVSGL